jgi:K+-transporting ATPase A subunit
MTEPAPVSPAGLLEVIVTLALVVVVARPVGAYMADVFQNRRTLLTPVLGPIERAAYWAAGVDAKEEQEWDAYAISVVLIGGACMLGLYALLRLQAWLPLNPQGFPGVEPGLAFNIAVSFVTNANWQAYAGETTLSNLSQMLGLNESEASHSSRNVCKPRLPAVTFMVFLLRGRVFSLEGLCARGQSRVHKKQTMEFSPAHANSLARP